MVFPERVVSQTTDDGRFTPPPIQFLEANPEVVQQAEVLYRATKTQGNLCSCVLFVKGLTGFSQAVGRAKNWPTNSALPAVGGVVITNESSYGHVAFIKSIDGNVMTLVEANYIPCRKGGREMRIDDPRIIGFWVNH